MSNSFEVCPTQFSKGGEAPTSYEPRWSREYFEDAKDICPNFPKFARKTFI